jgi:hypothetical protein
MLTVWIDDSAEQDRRVLEHLKETEAGACRRGDDPDVLTCRALWSVLKQQRIFVRSPSPAGSSSRTSRTAGTPRCSLT